MKRNKKGRFSSESEADENKGYKFTITFPSIKNLFFLIIIVILVSPWVIILERYNILQKLLEFFETILIKKEKSKIFKKNGLFY